MNKHMRRIKDHIWGPTGSVILHIIIVIVLINFLVIKVRRDDPDIQFKVVPMEVRENKKPKPIDEIEPVLDIEETIKRPQINEELPDPSRSDNTELKMDPSILDVKSDVQGALELKDLIAGRSPGNRGDMIDKYGYKWGKLTESAVIKALDWLKDNQIKEGPNRGSWDSGSKSKDIYVALAGNGLLAFLGHDETTNSEKYGDTVLRAIEFLQHSQQPDGAFCPLNQHGVYAHAIATYAISETYALTRIPPLKDRMNRAIEKIVQGQQPGGGWDYHYHKSTRRDTSVASWQIQALKAGYMAGSDVPGIKESLHKAADDLKSVYLDQQKIFSYAAKGKGTISTTSMGALCLQLIGFDRDDAVRGALNRLKDEKCSWDIKEPRAIYMWYYLTQAKFHSGGSDWKDWNNQFAPAYVKNQQDDGHWDPPVKKGGDAVYGPAFTTALGALTLEVYYRFLPTYQEEAVEKIKIDVDKGDKDIEIDIS